MDKNKRDMTKDKILPQLIIFALPLLGSSLIQQLYNTADLLFVGNFVGKASAAAVGSSSLIFTCLIGLFTGISVGAGIAISHLWGALKKEEAYRLAKTAMVMGIVGSFVLMIIGLLGAYRILEFLHTPKEIMKEAVLYLRIYFLSMIPMVIYNMGASILRACGNSKVPFYILIGGGVINIVMDAIFVVVLGHGVAGVAIATSISQTVSAVCMVCYLISKHSPICVFSRDIQLELSSMRSILKYGLPAGIQAIVITISNVAVQYYINGYGQNVVAAYTAYFKIENVVYLPIMACGQAITTFVGQNYGCGLHDRIKKGTIQGVLLTCVITIIITQLILLVPEMAVGLFIKDGSVISYGICILATTFPLYWLYAILEVIGGSLRGMGYSIISMIVVMTGLCGLRVILLYVINYFDLSFKFVASVYPITWGVTAMVFLTIFFFIMFKKKAVR